MSTLKGFIQKHFDKANSTRERGGLSLGVNYQTGEYINLTADDAAQGTFITGCGCSGRSERLQSIARESIDDGGGLIFVDASGFLHNFTKFYLMAAAAGRLNDLYCLNLTLKSETDRYLNESNTWNPFITLNAADILSLLKALPSSNLDNVRPLLIQIIISLVDRRDRFRSNLDLSVMRNHLDYDSVMEIRNTTEVESVRIAIDEIFSVFDSLEAKRSFSEMFAELVKDDLDYLIQHHSDTFLQDRSDINLRDIIMTKKILIVMLPCLEKADDEQSVTGRMVLTALQDAFVKVSNSGARALKTRIILDDIGRYGEPVFDAEAVKVLKLQLIYSVQDYSVIKNYDSIIMDALSDTCLQKIFMANCESIATFEMFCKYGQLAPAPSSLQIFKSIRTRSGQCAIFRGIRTNYELTKIPYKKLELVELKPLTTISSKPVYGNTNIRTYLQHDKRV